MRNYCIYEIKNVKNGLVYIGMTGQQFAARWHDHLHRLRTNTHFNIKFQQAWNASAGICDWSFRVLKDEVHGIRLARCEEKMAIIEQNQNLVLNERKSGIDWSKILLIREMREAGHMLKDIVATLDVSIGTVSKVINKSPPYDFPG